MRRTVLAVMMITAVSVPAAWSAEGGRSDQRRRTSFNQPRQSARKARPIRSRLNDVFEQAVIPNMPARDALNWWSRTTGINLVVNWRGLEEFGIDPQTPININLRHVPVGQVLMIMLRQMSVQEPLIYQTTHNYLEVLTKEQANRLTETRIYDVSDLLVVVPNFNTAPQFDLNAALSNTNSGGSGTGTTGGNRGGSSNSSSGIFADNDNDDQEPQKSRTERGKDLAQLIRDTIEPEIWASHGGEHASIRYFQGRLVIKAPRYVHEQIGLPTKSSKSSPAHRRPLRTKTYRPGSKPTEAKRSTRRSGGNGVSGIGLASPQRVSGIGR